MDRELPSEFVRKRGIKRAGVIVLSATILIAGFFGFRSLLTQSIDRSRIRTAIAERGSIRATVSASGTVVPEFEGVITSPIQTKIDSVFLKSGDHVSKGEPMLKLNTDALRLKHDRLSDELELQRTKKKQLQLQMTRTEAELQAQYEIKELQVKFSNAQLEREQKLYEVGATNKSLLEQAQLNVEIAQRELKLLDEQISNQQASLTTDLKAVDLEIRIRENSLAETERQMDLAEAKADRDGILTWVKDDIGATVSPGEAIARIADLGSYKVEAQISEIHAGKLEIGGAVIVRINERDLSGKISGVQPAVENGVMTFMVELDRRSDSLLRPNQRADVYVVTASRDNVVRVTNGPFYRGTVDQPVFVVKGDKAVRRMVNIGESNYEFVELQGDIEAGEEVIISNMWDYRHMKEIQLNNR
jgi:HlyD family secretion protein